MNKFNFAFINFITRTAACIFTIILVCEFYLFCQGIRLDWYSELHKHYNIYIDENIRHLAEVNGWFNGIRRHVSDEDPEVIENVWPNYMRVCRSDMNKKSKINVLFIDGSFTFGTGVKDEDTMVYRLNEMYPDVTFDNYACGGYGPVQSFNLLKYLLENKKYDLVVYNINYGNFMSNFFVRVEEGSLRLNHLFLTSVCMDKNLFGFWRVRNLENFGWPFQHRLLVSDVLLRLNLINSADKYFYNSRPETFGKNNSIYQEAACRIIKQMDDVCRENNADFIICSLEDCVRENVFPVLKQTGVYMLNVGDARFDAAEYRVKKNIKYHPNGVVHKYWAERFSEWFDKQDYLKKAGVKTEKH